MLLMAAGGLLVVLVCVDMGIKQYIEENFEEEEERETILDKVVLRKVYNKGFCFNTLDSDIINDFSTNQSVIGIADCTGCQKYHAEFSEPFSFFEKEPCIINCKPCTQDTRCLSHQLRLLIQCIKTADFEDSPRTWQMCM